MSADTTVLILETTHRDGRPEYRVRCVQNAEMAEDDFDTRARADYIRHYFAGAHIHRQPERAQAQARNIERRYGYVEYGIRSVKLPGRFPSAAAANPAPAPAPVVSERKPGRRKPSMWERRALALGQRVEDLEKELSEALRALRSAQMDIDLAATRLHLAARHKS